MTQKENKYYIYRHINPKTNEVFYIGMGQKDRYKSKHGRNRMWNFIATKYGFIPEIIAKDLIMSDAEELEIFLISLYGRKIKSEGTLVNIREGGNHFTEDQILKASMADRSYQTGGKNWKSKKVIDITNETVFNSAKEASEFYKISYVYLMDVMTKENNTTTLMYLENYKKDIHYNPNAKWMKKDKELELIDVIIKQRYPTIKDAAMAIGIDYNGLRFMINGKKPNTTNLIKFKDFDSSIEYKENEVDSYSFYHISSPVIHTPTKQHFKSIKNACEALQLDYGNVQRMLKGKVKNTSNLILKNNYDPQKEYEIKDYVKPKRQKESVINTLTGEIFETICECARYMKIPQSTLAQKLRNNKIENMQHLSKYLDAKLM